MSPNPNPKPFQVQNSGFVVGVVVYAGRESRIAMNMLASPMKPGAYDRFLNGQMLTLVLLQVQIRV